MEVKLLDCTLRDGGYINDWKFGHNNLISVYERLTLSEIDIVEVGFLDDRRPFDVDRCIFPNTKSLNEIYNNVSSKAPLTVAMIDYGTCEISNIEPCGEGFIDGIRVIFKKHRMDEAMEYCRQLKELGYIVFTQLVSITSYEEEDIEKLAKLVNVVKPYAVSIVDTYGLLYPDTTIKYYKWLDKYIDKSVCIGFHAHNNLQLAYANALAFINNAEDRTIIVDGTLHGMGKSAGNAPTELLAPYLNDKYNKHYDIHHMLEAYDESLKDIYYRSPWGYKTLYYLSSENNCHPSYVRYLLDKNNLSLNDINSILGKMNDKDIKLLYDRDYVERLYQEYVEDNYSEKKYLPKIASLINSSNILIIGPGKNIRLQKRNVDTYIGENSPTVISVNYIPDEIAVDYVFVTRKNRYQELSKGLNMNPNIQIINTSDVDVREKVYCTLLRNDLLDSRDDIRDNPFVMLLKLLKAAGIKKIACAGFDGYSDVEDNYYKQSMENNHFKTVARRLNSRIRDILATDYNNIEFDFVTYSHYAEDEDSNSGGF